MAAHSRCRSHQSVLNDQALLPGMLARGHGVFINMSSIAGLVGGGGGVAYTAAKHAVIGLTKQLDLDYAAKGIRANALAPGAINTPMNAADFAGDGKMAAWVAQETPAKRWAKPEEVAQLSLFLASDAADYIHGTVIPIDGGWLRKVNLMHCNTKTENGRQSFHDDTYFPLIVVTTGIATKENKHANNFNHPSFNRQSRQNRHDHVHLRRDDPHAQSTQLRGRTSSVLRDAQLHGTLQPPLCLGRHAGCFWPI